MQRGPIGLVAGQIDGIDEYEGLVLGGVAHHVLVHFRVVIDDGEMGVGG